MLSAASAGAQADAAVGDLFDGLLGDQPALTWRTWSDWARNLAAFNVTALPGAAQMACPGNSVKSTPETVWDHGGRHPVRAANVALNPKMFNSFLDGSKTGAIEILTIANATGLLVPSAGCNFGGRRSRILANIMRRKS